MTLVRTFTRTAAATAAAAALTVGAAGAASAATANYTVDGDTVSVTFALGLGDLTAPADSCVAVVAERGQASGIADRIKQIVNLDNIVDTLRGERTTVLTTGNGMPVALLHPGQLSVTLSAGDVPTGAHSLITYCAKDTVPVLRTISVGGASIPMGSIAADGPALLSSGMNLF